MTTTTKPIALDWNESGKLAKCEKVIRDGLDAFTAVGEAMATIRDERLYRASHKTFEAYLREKWDISARYAEFQMSAAETVARIKNANHGSYSRDDAPKTPLPVNERQARPLAKLPANEQADAWTEAVATSPNGKVTAAHVERVVEQRIAKPAAVERDEFDESDIPF